MSSKRRKSAKRKTATKKAVKKPAQRKKPPKANQVVQIKNLTGYAIEVLESIQEDLKAIRLHLVPQRNEKMPEEPKPVDLDTETAEDDATADLSNDEAFQ